MGKIRVVGERFLLAMLFIGILAYESFGIATPGMWWDEASTISAATRDWRSFFHLINLIDAVHAVYYVCLHYWIQLFGQSAFVLRLPSAIAVTFGCWFTYLLGKRLRGSALGVLAAVLLAILPRASWAATEARSYGFSLALAAASSLAFVIASQATASGAGDVAAVKKWRVYRYAAIASNYVFLYSLLVTISHGVSLFAAGPSKRQDFKAWARSFWIIVVSSLPILVYGSIQNGQIGWIDWKLANIADLWFKQNFLHNESFAEYGWSILILALLVHWVVVRRRSPLLALTLSWWLFPTLLLIAYSVILKPIYNPRYLAMAAPAVALLLAWSMATLATFAKTVLQRIGLKRVSWLGNLVVGALLVLAMSLSTASYLDQRQPEANNTDWVDVSKDIAAESKPGDAVLWADNGRTVPTLSRIAIAYPESFRNLAEVTTRKPFFETKQLYADRFHISDVLDRIVTHKRVFLLGMQAGETKSFRTISRLLAEQQYVAVQGWTWTHSRGTLFVRR